MTFRVMAEMHDGSVVTLRKGFGTEEAALDHPVRMSSWKRVWVEPDPPKATPGTFPPPFPWDVEWFRGHAYLIDATGKKIAVLLGSQDQREYIANFICGAARPSQPKEPG